MTELLDAMERFKTQMGSTLYRVQSERILDTTSIRKIEKFAAEVAVLAKPHSMHPKSMLNAFRMATKVLRNEALTIARPAPLTQLADAMEMVFDLVPMGEAPQDRIPSQPRIIEFLQDIVSGEGPGPKTDQRRGPT